MAEWLLCKGDCVVQDLHSPHWTADCRRGPWSLPSMGFPHGLTAMEMNVMIYVVMVIVVALEFTDDMPSFLCTANIQSIRYGDATSPSSTSLQTDD